MKWTDEEIKILKEAYKNRDGTKNGNFIKDLAKKLNKTEGAIRNKAYSLKITKRDKYYTEEEIIFLKENYDKLSMNDLAVKLNRNESNIFIKMKELGLKKTKRQKNTINPKKVYIPTENDKKRLSEMRKEYYKSHEHPKGFKGHKHTNKAKTKISLSSLKKWEIITPLELEKRKFKQRITKIENNTLNPMKNQKNPYSRAKGGKRKDLDNIYFRSSWEANIARYYNYIGIKWEYEPKTFIFKDITYGSVSYTPDFYLPEEDKWIEVKGWMDGKSKTKLKRFKKQYPEEYKKLELIQQKEYNEIKRKMCNIIKNWE